MERMVQQIEQDVAHVVYYMNGGLSFDKAYDISLNQLNLLNEQINKHYQAQADAMNKGKKK